MDKGCIFFLKNEIISHPTLSQLENNPAFSLFLNPSFVYQNPCFACKNPYFGLVLKKVPVNLEKNPFAFILKKIHVLVKITPHLPPKYFKNIHPCSGQIWYNERRKMKRCLTCFLGRHMRHTSPIHHGWWSQSHQLYRQKFWGNIGQ